MLRALLRQRSPRGGHPKVLDRGRALVANLTFVQLLGIFAVVYAVLAALAALALMLTADRGGGTFLHWMHESVMGLAGSPLSDLSQETTDDGRRIVQAAIAFTSVLLPGVFLGAIVFRLFVRDRTLVFRQQPALIRRDLEGKPGCWRLALRLYPATYLLLLDIEFSVYLQQATIDRDGGLVLHNHELECANPRWPVGDTHSPYSLFVDLETDEVDESVEGPPRLVALQGHQIDEHSQLIVHAVGHIPELATEFSEHHRVHLPDPMTASGYYGVTVLYDGKGPTWEGWRDFDEVRPHEEDHEDA